MSIRKKTPAPTVEEIKTNDIICVKKRKSLYKVVTTPDSWCHTGSHSHVRTNYSWYRTNLHLIYLGGLHEIL